MRKELTFKMSRQIIDMAEKPLRTREDAVKLLLYTIRSFDVSNDLKEERIENVIITINKMNRIFYLLDGKIFSMQFPFCIEERKHKDITIYHNLTDTVINSMVLSSLIEAFELMQQTALDFESIFELIMQYDIEGENYSMQKMWSLLSYLLKFDLGYVRCDIDLAHENGRLHPLNHLDVCLDTSATYKIGLHGRIDFDSFKDLLDVTTNCWYLDKGKCPARRLRHM